MSNKSNGSAFEKEFAKILSLNGFWVRADKGSAQTCDLIAGRNNIIYLFECKVCAKNYFTENRIEDNQRDSRRRFLTTGNKNAWFVYKLPDGGIRLSLEPLKYPSDGIELKHFLTLLKINNEVIQ